MAPMYNPHHRPCPSLHSVAVAVLAKALQRAFYILGKKGIGCIPKDFLQNEFSNEMLRDLAKKNHLSPVHDVRRYVSLRLPIKCRQEVFDEVLNGMTSPEDFEAEKLLTEIEFEFKAHDAVVKTSDMNHVMQAFLKCLLLGYVSKLDLSTLYTNESCWVARARRVIGNWSEKKKSEKNGLKDLYGGRGEIYFLESMWDDMVAEHRRIASEAVVASAPSFQHLTSVNIDHVATGEIVWEVTKNCPILQELSLFLDTTDRRKYSMQFEDNLIMSLTGLYGHKITTQTLFSGKAMGCSKLQRIVFPLVDQRQKLQWVESRLIFYLSRLKEIINGHTILALETMFSELQYDGKPLALTHIEDVATVETLEDLLVSTDQFQLKTILPKVTSVKVIQNKQRGGLQYLNNFPRLRYVEIISSGDFEFAFQTSQLTHFKSTCSWDQKKLSAFSQRTSALEVMVFITGTLQRHKNFKGSMSFSALRVLKLYHVSRVDMEAFTALLKSTKTLTHIIVEDSPRTHEINRSLIRCLNDKAITVVLPYLKKLQVFHAAVQTFGRYRVTKFKYLLTMKSVKAFISSCPNLKYIGNLNHWDISCSEIESLKKQIIEKNWSLHLDSVDISTI